MDRLKKIASILVIAFTGAILAIYLFTKIEPNWREVVVREKQPIQLTSYTPASPNAQLPDLTQAAEKSIHSVVGITTKTKTQSYGGFESPFDFFFGPRGGSSQEPQFSVASGSGVILSADGYIVTNNHVVESADNIEVVLNDNRKFTAKLIGRDPNTDIALIKIDVKDVSPIEWGNSDALKLGEWVLAVGNPFNLTSTVTAGIVSAKARSIGIMSGQMPLESFIQTDAAVNPGNSGGALVNSLGELVGINTAIASRTGSYSGYSFAVPASIAKKVVEDLKKYGEVQRALLGITGGTVDAELIKEKSLKLDKVEGVYISSTTEDGAARKAGIKEGDVIIGINGNKVSSMAELQGQIGRYSPGDKVDITAIRSGSTKQFPVVLRNMKGDTSVVKDSFSLLGAEFASISAKDQERLDIEEGVQVVNISAGKLKEAGVKVGFIITDVNKMSVGTVEDIKRAISMSSNKKPILIEGVYPDGKWAYYVFNMND
jgi:Do/DeqQ family serine protease